MKGSLYVTCDDELYREVVSRDLRIMGFEVTTSGHSGYQDDLQLIQECDFVLLVLGRLIPMSSTFDAGYAYAHHKPVLVYLNGVSLDDFRCNLKVIQSALAVVSSPADLLGLLALVEPLCGLSLVSEQVAERIALIQSRYGIHR